MSSLDSVMADVKKERAQTYNNALVARLKAKNAAPELIAVVVQLIEGKLTERLFANLISTIGSTFPLKVAHYSSSDVEHRPSLTVATWYQYDICLLRDGSIVSKWISHEERTGDNPSWFTEKGNSGEYSANGLIEAIDAGLNYDLWVHDDFKTAVSRISGYQNAQSKGTGRTYIESIKRDDAQRRQKEQSEREQQREARKRQEEESKQRAAIAKQKEENWQAAKPVKALYVIAGIILVPTVLFICSRVFYISDNLLIMLASYALTFTSPVYVPYIIWRIYQVHYDKWHKSRNKY